MKYYDSYLLYTQLCTSGFGGVVIVDTSRIIVGTVLRKPTSNLPTLNVVC